MMIGRCSNAGVLRKWHGSSGSTLAALWRLLSSDHRNALGGIARAELAAGLVAIHFGHDDVHQDHVGPVVDRLGQRVAAAASGDRVVAGISQQRAQIGNTRLLRAIRWSPWPPVPESAIKISIKLGESVLSRLASVETPLSASTMAMSA